MLVVSGRFLFRSGDVSAAQTRCGVKQEGALRIKPVWKHFAFPAFRLSRNLDGQAAAPSPTVE
jgi:hypothetical protein